MSSEGVSAGPMAPRILRRVDALAGVSESPRGLLRRFATPEHARANELVGGWMAQAGMSVRVDAIGNVVGRYEGRAPGAPALLVGSHLDTVADAGKYDGMLGVITGIECVHALAAAGRRLEFAVEVIGFADEEGVRFQSTYLGSRAVAGTFDPALLERVDADGIRMSDALRGFGLDPTRIDDARRAPQDLVGYVELHIEQGPVLEREGVALGVVSAIAGATRLAVVLTGEAGHAGTVPMTLRRDALAAAAEAVLLVERRCAGTPGLVGTVGRIDARPGAVNVIPGEVALTVDIRCGEDAGRRAAVADVESGLHAIAERRGVDVRVERTHEAASCPCSDALSAPLARAVEAQCGRAVRLASGAGHDAAALSALTRVGMLFVRCAGGVSHNPAESVTAEDVEAGARALLRFLADFRPEE